MLECANPVKFPRSLPEFVSSGVPRPALFLDLTRIVDKGILSTPTAELTSACQSAL
jgi:hypothetical protein